MSQGVKFNKILNRTQALSTSVSHPGTVYFTTDGAIVINGEVKAEVNEEIDFGKIQSYSESSLGPESVENPKEGDIHVVTKPYEYTSATTTDYAIIDVSRVTANYPNHADYDEFDIVTYGHGVTSSSGSYCVFEITDDMPHEDVVICQLTDSFSSYTTLWNAMTQGSNAEFNTIYSCSSWTLNCSTTIPEGTRYIVYNLETPGVEFLTENESSTYQYINGSWMKLSSGLSNAVITDPQSLTEEQQMQVRKNLDLYYSEYGGYVEPTLTNEITWDGDTTGLISTNSFNSIYYYKVSDLDHLSDLGFYPIIDQYLDGGSFGIFIENTTENIDITYEESAELEDPIECSESNDIIVMMGDCMYLSLYGEIPAVVFAPRDGSQLMGWTFPEAGIYFLSIPAAPGAYVSRLTLTHDAFGDDGGTPEIIHKVPAKYLDAVAVTEQTLSTTEQMQARENQGLYYEKVSSNPATDTITFDGDVTGRDHVRFYYTDENNWSGLVKISDYTPSIEELEGATVHRNNVDDSVITLESGDYGNMSMLSRGTSDPCLQCEPGLLVFYHDGVELSGDGESWVIPSAGIYVVYEAWEDTCDGVETSYFTEYIDSVQATSTIFGTPDEIHKVPSKFIPWEDAPEGFGGSGSSSEIVMVQNSDLDTDDKLTIDPDNLYIMTGDEIYDPGQDTWVLGSIPANQYQCVILNNFEPDNKKTKTYHMIVRFGGTRID